MDIYIHTYTCSTSTLLATIYIFKSLKPQTNNQSEATLLQKTSDIVQDYDNWK